MITKDKLITMIERYAVAKAALSIPTGDLYRGIAQDQFMRERKTLYDAINDLEARIKDAFFEGYDSKKYYYDDEITNVLEEWKKYNEN